MSIELKIPAIGESVSEIYIGQWYKSEGDHVALDESLLEVESEKATLDVPAPSAGVLTKILKRAGDVAEVGEVIAYLEASASEQPTSRGVPAPSVPRVSANAPPQPPRSEPLSPTAARRDETAPAVEPLPLPHAAQGTPSFQSAEKTASVPANRLEETVPVTPVRRRIAARLLEATRNAALLTTFNEVDMTAVKQLRTEFGASFEKRHGVRLGFMSFFVRAAVEALKQCPEINAIFDGDRIVYRRYYDVGVAIGSDRGLVVPVLRNAEAMSFAQVEQAINDFAGRAQTGSLRVEELLGGTFTITNGGVYGSLLSTPIVNPPQSGVLGMHAIQDRPVAINGQVVVRPMMYLALTYDHRIVDGREAVTFLRNVKESIESPARMLLEA